MRGIFACLCETGRSEEVRGVLKGNSDSFKENGEFSSLGSAARGVSKFQIFSEILFYNRHLEVSRSTDKSLPSFFSFC